MFILGGGANQSGTGTELEKNGSAAASKQSGDPLFGSFPSASLSTFHRKATDREEPALSVTAQALCPP
ncbi:hypothetical protein PR202_gb06212 [Eleusine coracana subsp. coracana]|uniref:Uncharacterized protein n=1 Tax=Eleusine coracana subsp. coracana TaxID=191504 RepID=A0AAV5E940_ELECO|nr:hypothetical protein PR202_gb06212 [Eleusine coracana subsp. coracana]